MYLTPCVMKSSVAVLLSSTDVHPMPLRKAAHSQIIRPTVKILPVVPIDDRNFLPFLFKIQFSVIMWPCIKYGSITCPFIYLP